MGEWKSSRWYDKAYRDDPNLDAEMPCSTFGDLWLDMSERIPVGARVIEIGCGAGQLSAHILHKINAYLGMDFSEVAVNLACRRSNFMPPPPGGRMFLVHEITEQCIPTIPNPTHLLACEVLEHLRDDHDLTLLFPFPGVRLVASLPTRDSASHVRHFPTTEDVLERYGPHLIDPIITRFDQWHILEGIIK